MRRGLSYGRIASFIISTLLIALVGWSYLGNDKNESKRTEPDAGKLEYVVENFSLTDYLEKYEEIYGEDPRSVILWKYGLGELQKYSMEDGNGGILEYYSLEELSKEKYAMSLLGYIRENYDVDEVLEIYLDNDPECLDDFWRRETGE